MTESRPEPRPIPTPAPRLEGWKEISAYLRRGPRTVQRWEKELGMPVHRQITGAGETVFAIPDEIDAWRKAQTRHANGNGGTPAEEMAPTGLAGAPAADPATPAPRLRHWRLWVVGLGLTAVVVAAVWTLPRWTDRPAASAARQPAALVAVGNMLAALDIDGQRLWARPFKTPLFEGGNPAVWSEIARAADVDGDGNNEALLARHDVADAGLYAFSAAGRPLFRHEIDRQARFGAAVFARPWQPDKLFLLSATRSFAVSFHVVNLFAGVVQELDLQNRVLGEYWTNGYVSSFSRIPTEAGSLTFVGASFNESGGGSLAVFRGPLTGAAPAETPKYRCVDCPAGTPDVFLVFPRSRLQEQLGVTAEVLDVAPVSPGQYIVRVQVAKDDAGIASAYYRIDASGHILDADVAADLNSLQGRLEKTGSVPAATRSRGIQDLFPVLRWNGRSFDRITGIEAR